MGCVSTKYSASPKNRHSERPKRENNHDEFSERASSRKPISQKNHSSSRAHDSSNHVEMMVDAKADRVVNLNVIKGGNDDKCGEGENVSESKKNKSKITDFDVVEEYPKWLLDNIPQNVLASFVRKTADSYEKLAKVGRGTYSNVYKARDKYTGKIVALKKVRFDTSDSESIKFMAREIMILQTLDHPNVIKLEGLVTSRMQYSLYLVFEYMHCDFTRIISHRDKLTESQIKCYMRQLLLGLQHCHERGVMHRDIKASNLLIDRKGVLKIADFGLAKSFTAKPKMPLTNRVVTLWYRAPELLLGSTDYDYGIDLWSVGCLLAEMFVGRPIMPGRTEVEQLHMIFKLCGSPSDEYWVKMKLMTSFRPPQRNKANLEEKLRDFPSSARLLLTTLLHLDSKHRGTAASALESEFFKSSPPACDISELPAIFKAEDERSQIKRRKRRKGLKKGQLPKRSGSSISLSRMNQTAEQLTRKEDKSVAKNMQDEETRNGGSSKSSSLFSMNNATSISPVFVSKERKSPKTEGHPNALKNVKNYTLLHASILDMINRNEGNDFGQYRRSFSMLDLRLDPENLPTLYGSNHNLDHQV